jgi:hypothetical protein
MEVEYCIPQEVPAMHRRLLASLVLATATSLSLIGPALAGGWAVTSFDRFPAELHAGETYTLVFTIRQHGVRPFDGAQSAIRIWNPKSGETFRFAASPAKGGNGQYMARVSVPVEGAWRWEVDQNPFGVQDLGEISVLPPVPAHVGQTTSVTTSAPGPGLSAAALIVLGAGLAAVALLLPQLGSAQRVGRNV